MAEAQSDGEASLVTDFASVNSTHFQIPSLWGGGGGNPLYIDIPVNQVYNLKWFWIQNVNIGVTVCEISSFLT